MFNLKKQINKLYISEILGNISLTGAWVAILAARGFSLLQIGLSETIFHIVSLLFEIPSGVLADVFGRKKMLLISCCLNMLSDLIMIFSNSFGIVCFSFCIRALSYNFYSGSDEALAYDSMKSQGKENLYEKYSSNQLIIYRVTDGISTMAAGLALYLGYRIAYAISLIFMIFQLVALSGLKEINFISAKEKEERKFLKEILNCFKESFTFLIKQKKVFLLMLTNSFVGALDILLLFFLQAKLPQAGIPEWALGFALLIMQAGGILGAKLILKLKSISYPLLFGLCVAIVLLGIFLEHTGMYVIMTLGGFLSALADDTLQVRSNKILQDKFPSEQRAALGSVESFSFSIIMLILSPLAGFFYSFW